MVLRLRTFFIVASLSLLVQPNFAEAQGKRKAAAPKPAESTLKTIAVCVRPNGVGEKVQKWGYDRTNKVVTTNVDDAVRFAGGRWVYVFDAKAAFDNVKFLPAPHNALKCPNDDRKPPPPPPPKPRGILPQSGPAFPSSNPLAGANASLAPQGFGSSGTAKPSTAMVTQFCSDVDVFSAGEDPNEVLAVAFANKLRDSIVAKKSIGQIKNDELNIEAASLLRKHFGDNVAAAFERADVIAPLSLLKKLVPTAKNPQWEPLPLVAKQPMTEFQLGSADSVMAVILSRIEHDRMTNLLAQRVSTATTKEALHGVYKWAYVDRPSWLGAISGYFAKN